MVCRKKERRYSHRKINSPSLHPGDKRSTPICCCCAASLQINTLITAVMVITEPFLWELSILCSHGISTAPKPLSLPSGGFGALKSRQRDKTQPLFYGALLFSPVSHTFARAGVHHSPSLKLINAETL